MKNALLVWRQSATKSEWSLLAEFAGTTPGYLNLIAYGYRKASPKLAISIECASKKIPEKELITKESLIFPHSSPAHEAQP